VYDPGGKIERLRAEHGYGMMRIPEGAGKGYQAVWATKWPPPERMLLIVPHLHPSTMIELPEEPHQLEALREGKAHGWQIYEMHRGDHSKISDEDAKSMTHVVRVAEYAQGAEFEP
jgi:hypothetical protein